MQASILDLRYRMRDVLKALKRNEKVEILYHGKACGVIVPHITKTDTTLSVSQHPFFGMHDRDSTAVETEMDHLRGGVRVIFDTDVLIYAQCGNHKAATIIENSDIRQIALQTYLELLQAAHNKKQHQIIISFLKDFAFTVLPLTANIGHRAAIYVEEYSLASGMRAGDALVAATAVENSVGLISANHKHYKIIQDLQLKVFKP